jgi:hypothetical protein
MPLIQTPMTVLAPGLDAGYVNETTHASVKGRIQYPPRTLQIDPSVLIHLGGGHTGRGMGVAGEMNDCITAMSQARGQSGAGQISSDRFKT